jgi:sugar O-acyltransferase (sialic acid O-acetyltransferase NeuD family)
MKKTKIAILGVGHFAQEIFPFLLERSDLEICCWVDVNPSLPMLEGLKVMEENLFWARHRQEGIEAVAIAVGKPQVRDKLFQRLQQEGLGLIGHVHPSAVIGASNSIGEGAIIYPMVCSQVNVRIGTNALVNAAVTLGHDTCVGDFANLNPGANIAGCVTISRCAFIGIGATIIENITIGENAVVGAGAVVIDDVPAGTVVVGVPAKVLKRASK